MNPYYGFLTVLDWQMMRFFGLCAVMCGSCCAAPRLLDYWAWLDRQEKNLGGMK
jgi:hypothetical protein